MECASMIIVYDLSKIRNTILEYIKEQGAVLTKEGTLRNTNTKYEYGVRMDGWEVTEYDKPIDWQVLTDRIYAECNVHYNLVTISDPVSVTSPLVNDHTCPTCKNDRCSKSEKSCWKCGGLL